MHTAMRGVRSSEGVRRGRERPENAFRPGRNRSAPAAREFFAAASGVKYRETSAYNGIDDIVM